VNNGSGIGAIEAHPEPDQQAGRHPVVHEHLSVIDSREDYLHAVTAISHGHGPIAIDAERASGFTYSQRAYLIQIFRQGAGTFLFDPPAIGSFSELNTAISGEEWVLHAASQDLNCLREIGLNPTRIFDTELGARLAGLPRVGLGAVVEELLGIHLAKEHSAADWSTRPLPQSWLVYAALDVELLVDLQAAMRDLLESAGKWAFAEQEFAAIVLRDFVIVRAEPWRRLSGLNTVRGARNLAVARELWRARDDYAREIDTAPGRLVPDLSLCAAARVLPQTQGELAALKEFSGRASRTQLNRWWLAIQEGLASTDLPNPRAQGNGDTVPPPRVWAEKAPIADRRLRGARAALLGVSETLNIPVENLLLPETLRRICWNPPEPLSLELLRTALEASDARSWQVDTVLQPIMGAFVEAAQEPEPPQDTTS